MAKYVQPNFIIDSSASFNKTTNFHGEVLIKSATNVDASLYVKGTEVGSMIYESSINYYDASTVEILIDAIDVSTTLKFIETDASIDRIDASLNDVIDISEIIDASLATKVDKAGDTMTGELVLDAGLQLDSISITTIDTSAEGLSQLDTAIPTSAAVKALVDSAISDGVTASNGLTETQGDIQLGGSITSDISININSGSDRFSFINQDNIHLLDIGLDKEVSYSGGLTNLRSTYGGGINELKLDSGSGSNKVQLSIGGADYLKSNLTLNEGFSASATYVKLERKTDLGAATSKNSYLELGDIKTEYYSDSSVSITYAADYSDFFVPRSLVDKGYVDTAISTGAFVLTDGNGTTANGTAVDLGGPLTKSTTITTDGNLFAVAGNFTINGDLTVDGSTTTVNSVNLDVSDNIITVNAGETGSGVSLGHAGLLIDRGQLDPYVFVFEEATATFRVGIETEASLGGSTQAVATREDNPTANGIGFWNDTESRIDTSIGLVFTYGVGVEYEEDLHSSYTSRTLVDKAYVDDKVGTVDAWNGLTNTDGSIGLGGTLTSNTEVTNNYNGSTFATRISDANSSNYNYYTPTQSYLTVSNNLYDQAYMHIDLTSIAPQINIYTSNASGDDVGLYIDSSLGEESLTIKDDINSKGIVYFTDYSAKFTERSLVDKAYVDTQISGGGAKAWNGLTKTVDGSIGLGGTVTDDVNIDVSNGSSLVITSLESKGYTYTEFGDDFFETYAEDAARDNQSFVEVYPDYVQLYSTQKTGSVGSSLYMHANGLAEFDVSAFTVGADGINADFEGITYTRDLSSNFVERSLVDKAYVDNKVTDAVSTGAFKYTGTFDGTLAITEVIPSTIHKLGAGPFNVSVYEDGVEVMADISYNVSGDVTIEWGSGTLNANCAYIIIG